MMKKTCLITGGNSGIGKQAAIQLAQKGFHVIIGVRDSERGMKALSEIKQVSQQSDIELIQVDMSSKKSILDASDELKRRIKQLDVLIHNAAEFDISRKQPEKSADGIERIWATNHIGPVLLTKSVLELINNSVQGRIITIASKGLIMYPKLKVDLKDPEFVNRRFSVADAYYQSKLAQVMYTYWLSGQLKDTGVTVNCIRVTNVKIDPGRYPDISGFMRFMYSIKSKFSISPGEMAETYTYLASSPDMEKITGKCFNEKNKVVLTSPYSVKKENIDAVVALTLKYIE